MLHQRHDEAGAAAEDEVRGPVAQRTVDQCVVAAQLGDQLVHRTGLAAGIGDVDIQACLGLDDVGQEFGINLGEGGAEFRKCCLIAEIAGELGKKGAVHRLCPMRGLLAHDRQAALLSPPGFIISCSTASIEGRS